MINDTGYKYYIVNIITILFDFIVICVNIYYIDKDSLSSTLPITHTSFIARKFDRTIGAALNVT